MLLEKQLQVIRKRNHPAILHSDVCFNEVGQMNDGPECRCSWAAKKSGLRHNKYAGETVIEKCDPSSRSMLYHSYFHFFVKNSLDSWNSNISKRK